MRKPNEMGEGRGVVDVSRGGERRGRGMSCGSSSSIISPNDFDIGGKRNTLLEIERLD